MMDTLDPERLQTRIKELEERVRRLSEEKANLHLVLHMVELLSPIAGVDSLLESLMSALCGSLGGTNVEVYYLDEERIHYANLLGERKIIEQVDDPLVAEVFWHHKFVEHKTDIAHTLLKNEAIPVAYSWVMPLLVGQELIGVVKMSDLLGAAQMRDYLSPFFRHMALILSNEIKTRIAQTANKAKSNFLATMSHEIRTPLNGILGLAQLLIMPGHDPEKQQEYAKTILSSGQILLVLLNDILDLSKIEASKLELNATATDPQQLLEEVSKLFWESARRKNLQFTACWHGPLGQCYLADAVRLRQMLSNLVNNAIKFTEHGFVKLEAREVSRAGEYVELEFSVSDSGIGIPAEQQSLLFKPFTQIDSSSTRRYGGTGLGLSIVRRFAELMKGSAGVKSRAGQGACFWFRIAATRIDCPQTLPGRLELTRPSTPGAKVSHVLVVDDNDINRTVVEAFLLNQGINVSLAYNGIESLETLADQDIDLVLMDCQMPLMDGYQTTQEIRQSELAEGGNSHLPIIALTGHASAENRQRCLQAGMDDVLVKPIDFTQLTRVLNHWLITQSPASATEPVKPADQTKPDNPQLILMFAELDHLLAKNMFSAIGKFKTLQNLLHVDKPTSQWIELGQLINDMKFDQAREQLLKVRNTLGLGEE